MRWRRFAVFGIALLLCGVTALFYGRLWIHGGEFRNYLIGNIVLVCSLSFILFVLRFLNLRLALWLTSKMNRWRMLWAGVGLVVPILLLLVDKFAPFEIGEPLLFTLWPTNIMFMAGDGSWSDVLLLVPLSLAVNATIYVGVSALVWWLVNLFQRHRHANTSI